MPKISVIIPFYKAETYFARCLDSLEAQTYTGFEVLLIDDRGEDGSRAIAEAYAARHPLWKVLVNEKNAGAAGSRDRGIREAAGEYITFVDADDYILPDYLENYAEEADGTADVIAGGYIRRTGDEEKVFPAAPDDPYYLYTHLGSWAKLYRRAFLIDSNADFRGNRIYEDGFFAYRYLMADPCVTYIDYEGYVYFCNPESFTMKPGAKRVLICEKYLDGHDDFLRESKIPEHHRQIVQYVLAQGLVVQLLYNGRGCGIRKMKRLFSMYSEHLDRLVLITAKKGERPRRSDLSKNPFISLRVPASEPWKEKCAAWLLLKLRPYGLDAPFYYLIACAGEIPQSRKGPQ